jgi:hypothetical protein
MKPLENQTDSNRHDIESQGLTITSRVLGLLIAGLIAVTFFVFMAGFFLGKKSVLEQFCQTAAKDSLADQIYSSLCAMPEYKEQNTSSDRDVVVDEEIDTTQDVVQIQDQEQKPVEPVIQQKNNALHDSKANLQKPVAEKNLGVENDKKYYAELIGFGTPVGAGRFVERLAKNNIKVIASKRVSTTARGRKVTWYQVVTDMFDQKDDLINVVNTITLQEKLKDVRIITKDMRNGSMHKA